MLILIGYFDVIGWTWTTSPRTGGPGRLQSEDGQGMWACRSRSPVSPNCLGDISPSYSAGRVYPGGWVAPDELVPLNDALPVGVLDVGAREDMPPLIEVEARLTMLDPGAGGWARVGRPGAHHAT